MRNIKFLVVFFLFAVVTIYWNKNVYAQANYKGVDIQMSSYAATFNLDNNQSKEYSTLKAKVEKSLEGLKDLKTSNPTEYYNKKKEIIYNVKMELKQSLNPEQRRLWREEEERIDQKKKDVYAALKAKGCAEHEIQEIISDLDIF